MKSIVGYDYIYSVSCPEFLRLEGAAISCKRHTLSQFCVYWHKIKLMMSLCWKENFACQQVRTEWLGMANENSRISDITKFSRSVQTNMYF